jgi:hypothetical protein
MAYVTVLHQHLFGEAEKIHEKVTQNKTADRYRYTSLLGTLFVVFPSLSRRKY